MYSSFIVITILQGDTNIALILHRNIQSKSKKNLICDENVMPGGRREIIVGLYLCLMDTMLAEPEYYV